LRDLDTKLGEHRRARAPLDQLYAEKPFQLVDLHRKSGLADATLRRSPPEMLMTGKCVQVTQLPDSDHADKIFLMPRQCNLIGFLGTSQKKWEPQKFASLCKLIHQRTLGWESSFRWNARGSADRGLRLDPETANENAGAVKSTLT
jgi:hypothetical protein